MHYPSGKSEILQSWHAFPFEAIVNTLPTDAQPVLQTPGQNELGQFDYGRGVTTPQQDFNLPMNASHDYLNQFQMNMSAMPYFVSERSPYSQGQQAIPMAQYGEAAMIQRTAISVVPPTQHVPPSQYYPQFGASGVPQYSALTQQAPPPKSASGKQHAVLRKREAATQETSPPQQASVMQAPVTQLGLQPSFNATVFAAGMPPPANKRIRASGSVATRARNPNSAYGNQMSGRPPHNTQPPRSIDITIPEILKFCPPWTQLPAVIARTRINGWPRKYIAKVILEATNTAITAQSLKRCEDRIQKDMKSGFAALFNVQGRLNTEKVLKDNNIDQDNDLTAANWRLRSYYRQGARQAAFGHVSLRDIWGVVPLAKWPVGADRKIFTMCLEFAASNPTLDLDTSHFDWIMRVLNRHQGPHEGAQVDVDALERVKG